MDKIIIKNCCELSSKLLNQINDYCNKYTGIDGKDVISENSLAYLQEILEEGFTLHNYLIENKISDNNDKIKTALLKLEIFMNQLTINKTNAEKLRLSNAVQIWNQAKIAIAILANTVLDEYENKE